MNTLTWITAEIRQICETYKNRSAGSESERACAEHFHQQMTGWADHVATESFILHPKAFIGSIPSQAALGLGSILSYWLAMLFNSSFFSFLCPILAIIGLASWLFEHILYREVTDILWSKKVSQNVMATRKASVETKRRIVLCAHSDAAYELPFLLKLKKGMIITLAILADVALPFCLFCGAYQFFLDPNSALRVFWGVLNLLGAVSFIPFLFFVNWKVIVDGANDNLSSCLIIMSILKEMEEKNERLEYTDVCCLITGGEESGLRGAFSYAKTHRKELLEIDTVVIAADTMHEVSQLMIYTKGINGTQKNDSKASELLRQAGKNCGISIPDAGFYIGATDAEAFSRYGIKATAICGVHHMPMSYYHTRFDTWNNLNADCISLTRDILKETIVLFDKPH